MSAPPSLVKRDRWIVGAGVAAVAALAWAYMLKDARHMQDPGSGASLGMTMAGPEPAGWSVGSLLPLFLMWSVMMLAMMLPSATPMILTFASVSRNRRRQQRPYTPVAVFVSGYIVVWCGFSALAAWSQWMLHRAALLSPAMASTSAVLGGVMLLGAGLFQFTPFKRSCLTHCRAPLEFIITRWREGAGGAFWMGVEHGAFCTGCCWALMCLLFVVGVMNIVWIAALTLLVALEKITPHGRWMSMATGACLTVWGIAVITGLVHTK